MADDKKVSVILDKKKDCKGSVTFENKETMAAVSNIYVNRVFSPINSAKRVRVTVEVLE